MRRSFCWWQVRIDHRTQSLSFGTDLGVAQKEDYPEGPYLQAMPSEQIRNQMTHMARALEKAINVIQPVKVRPTSTQLGVMSTVCSNVIHCRHICVYMYVYIKVATHLEIREKTGENIWWKSQGNSWKTVKSQGKWNSFQNVLTLHVLFPYFVKW